MGGPGDGARGSVPRTMLSQIVPDCARGPRFKAPMQLWLMRLAGIRGRVILIAISDLLRLRAIRAESAAVFGLNQCVAVLIIACPALWVLATTDAVMVATGKAA